VTPLPGHYYHDCSLYTWSTILVGFVIEKSLYDLDEENVMNFFIYEKIIYIKIFP
jgi:hypothetical protein